MTRRLVSVSAALALALAGCAFSRDPDAIQRPVPGSVPSGSVARGGACVHDGDCADGHCAPGGICCDRACTGACEACDGGAGTGGAARGTCATLAAGAQPHAPHATCATDGSTCGGACNGLSADRCAYRSDTCRTQTCADGTTQRNAASCDGAGSCGAETTSGCSPYACSGGACRTSCQIDDHCAPGSWCNQGTCVGTLAPGASCTAPGQCAGADPHCSPDGVCCDRACTGQCETCNGVHTTAARGTCGTIEAGSAPDPAHGTCAGDASGICHGSCDGTSAAACFYPTASCRSASCSGGTEIHAAACSGGSCPAAVTLACAPFVCGATACNTSCNGDAECGGNGTYYCDGGLCLAKKSNGGTCAADHECTWGNCVDGFCCNLPAISCHGCQACNVASHEGACTNVPAGLDPHGVCSASSCAGTCNGAAACTTLPANTMCSSASCQNSYSKDDFGRPMSTSASVAYCNGTTQSCPARAAGSCGSYVCSGGSCLTSCTGHEQCIGSMGGVTTSFLCAGGACVHCETNADCSEAKPRCVSGTCQCVSCDASPYHLCGANLDCTAGGWGDLCDTTGTDWGCRCTDGQAYNGRSPHCVTGTLICGQLGYGPTCQLGQLCTTGDDSGVCKTAPHFPCTGNAVCASGTCTSGKCTTLSSGKPCTRNADCTSGSCSGWKCT